jgi:hypothetical protein
MFKLNGMKRAVAMGVVTLALGACGDLLTVSDPQRYTASDLDEALPAIGNGVEGAFHEVVDRWAIDMALLADVYQHTGTWSGYDEVDHGRFFYGTSSLDGEFNSWSRGRWFAQDAAERFTRVLEGAAATDPLMAQVHMTEGLIELYMGLTYCEAQSGASEAAISSTALLNQAVTTLTRAIATAAGAGTSSSYGQAALMGRATANWALGNIGLAAADAAGVSAGFSYDAIFNQQSTNSIVQLTTAGYNEAGGLMYTQWNQIDLGGAGSMRDFISDEPDTRKPVYFVGEVATDNETPHYSQYKYDNETDDIPLLHYNGAQLIVAENLALTDLAGATAMLNTLRAGGGLSPLATATSAAEFQMYLMNERWAEHFMEGMRIVDLRHFGEYANVFNALDSGTDDYDDDGAPGDSERPTAGRPSMFPMSDTEALYNDLIEDNLTVRCLPTA